jgi:hypothetical protein
MKMNHNVKMALVAALLFYIVSSAVTYTLTDSILGSYIHIAHSNGAPTAAGLFVHTVVFGVCYYFILTRY